jgi:tetratricopeptide (TPR) repeat protein
MNNNSRIAERHKKKGGRDSTPPSMVMAEKKEILCQLLKGISKKRYQQIEWLLVEAYDEALGCSNDALELINKILRECPWLSKGRLARLYYAKGFAYHTMKIYDDAMVNYTRAITLDPITEGVYYFDRGRLKEDMGDEEGRLNDFNIGRKIYPELFEEYDEDIEESEE